MRARAGEAMSAFNCTVYASRTGKHIDCCHTGRGEPAGTRAGSGASTYRFDCALAQTALYCASGRREDTEKRATE